MKTIDVKDQPTLGAGRTAEICVTGIRYRLFRSVITVLVIAVAIAFMMNILCEAVSLRAVAGEARRRTDQQRLAAVWTARLTTPPTVENVLQELAAQQPGSPMLAEAQQFGKLSDTDFTRFLAGAKAAAGYLSYFDGLLYGQRHQLIGRLTGGDIFDALQDPAALQKFLPVAHKMKRLPGGDEAFTAFLHDWVGPTGIKATAGVIRDARAAAALEVAKGLNGKTLAESLPDAEGPLGEAIVAAGFTAFNPATRQVVAQQAQETTDLTLLSGALGNTSVRAGVASALNVDPGGLNAKMLWRLLATPTNATRYAKLLDDAKLPTLPVATIVGLAQSQQLQVRLDAALLATQDVGGGLLGLGGSLSWLVLISLLVCVVGITNAMLMSVTERFREIATLKCLGALDGFIMLLFVMEAGILGLVGGLLGALVGSLIGFSRTLIGYGDLLTSAFPWGAWAQALGAAVVVGVVLAALAGVYPSYVAARLAPMEAMRIE